MWECWHSHCLLLLPQLSKKPEKDQLLKETFGYSELAKYLEDTVDKLMTDSYQTTSMMNFLFRSSKTLNSSDVLDHPN